MLQNLNGRTALVCGASSGIGAATAHVLAEMGARVILLARNESALKSVQASLAHPEHKHDIWVQDLSDISSLKHSAQQAVKKWGVIDILVNNASGPPPGLALDATPEAITDTLNRHLYPSMVLTQCLVPHMRANKFGRIIQVISTSVKIPIYGLGVSNTVRGAVANWAKTLSFEVAADGVTVNSVLPGFTKTPRLQEIIQNKAAKLKKSASEIEEEMLREVPARRFAEPSEVAYAIAFLASPHASYINGVAIAVDGGRTGCY